MEKKFDEENRNVDTDLKKLIKTIMGLNNRIGLAMDHINQFLSHYNLTMKYQLEHKEKNNGIQLFYIKNRTI